MCLVQRATAEKFVLIRMWRVEITWHHFRRWFIWPQGAASLWCKVISCIEHNSLSSRVGSLPSLFDVWACDESIYNHEPTIWPAICACRERTINSQPTSGSLWAGRYTVGVLKGTMLQRWYQRLSLQLVVNILLTVSRLLKRNNRSPSSTCNLAYWRVFSCRVSLSWRLLRLRASCSVSKKAILFRSSPISLFASRIMLSNCALMDMFFSWRVLVMNSW